MKTISRGLVPLLACALLSPIAALAQTTPFTATGWVNGLPTPGLICTNAGGQVLLRGTVHTWGVAGPDARITGQVLNIGEAGYNIDGTANTQGAAYLQVGTWDSERTNFTPTAGMWDLAWRGVLQTNNSFLATFVGYGCGGDIDGLRLDGTLTRGSAAGPVDPAVPYTVTGTITPPPVSATLFQDEFTTAAQDWTIWGVGAFVTANEQLVAQTDGTAGDMHLLRCPALEWSLADGQTVECQADLAGITSEGVNSARLWVGDDDTAGYELDLGPGSADLLKWDMHQGMRLTCLWATNNLPWQRTNVVLSLALTRDQANLILTARVFDKANPGRMLLEHTFTDTPEEDAALTQAQFAALTGELVLPVYPDRGAPLLAGTVGGVGLYQPNGGSPVTAVWDNFVLCVHDVPPITIARAVQISWPASASANYTVEGSPTIQGPWLPCSVNRPQGLLQLALPASDGYKFYRLRQAP
ncbi:MAG: hypothetical protein AB9869_10895 [Verrucomicrobiia bacterium]